MRKIIVFFILSSFFIGCSNKEKSKNNSRCADSELINKKTFAKSSTCQSIKIEDIRNVPDRIVGAGCSFSFNEQSYKDEKYFWVDNITEGAIMINGNLEMLNFDTSESESKSDVFKFSNTNYRVYYRVMNTILISDDSSKLDGIMTVVKLDSNDSLLVKFTGLSY